VPIEQFLDRMLTPIARLSSVLLIVFDGLSFDVYRSFFNDLARQGWSELVPEDRMEAPLLIAAPPTVTEPGAPDLRQVDELSGRRSYGLRRTSTCRAAGRGSPANGCWCVFCSRPRTMPLGVEVH
jgi:hypothetical protein